MAKVAKKISILTVLVIVIFLFISFSKSIENSMFDQKNQIDEKKITYVGNPPPVPEFVVFAGDTILLNRADLRERMDRELVAFTFAHSTSVLIVKRANRFFPIIEPLLKENGIPEDLKYLMAIESNIDPTALSSAGAAGLWQFMQATGRSCGLEINANVDERYNTEAATKAACVYLRDSYNKYNDWITVAASYNAGQQGISKRLEKQRQISAIDLWLVEETSRYMFRILAAKMLLENPGSFGFYFTKEQLYPFIPPKEVLIVDYSIPCLVDFAEARGITYAQLKRANLWLREDKLNNSSKKRYKIIIPDVESENYDPAFTNVFYNSWIN
ncbi:MAG TPA: lytic transglycosylase domain-containing protein [Bacteroidaceae bacterium]|nr:lytic transglycosylase domain-containing protein [Bacteroidaceae bacterium]